MIRLAKKEDLPEISKLWVDMVKELEPDWTPDHKAWVETGVLLLETGMYYIVVSEDNGITGFLDGMAYLEPSLGKTIGVAKHFYLKPEYRGTGLMIEMYSEMVSIAKTKDVKIIELQCYPEKLDYWEGFGFKQDQYVLRKEI